MPKNLSRDELGILSAQLLDAERDCRDWLNAGPSAEEQMCVSAMQARIQAMERTVDHCIYGWASDEEEAQWDGMVSELLLWLQKATEARGSVVGTRWNRLTRQLKPIAEPEHKPTVGELIKRYRELCKWTQAKLAEEVKLDPGTVSRHENDSQPVRDENLGQYEAAFSRKLGRPISLRN